MNAASFRNMDLTKRCLYLFAGSMLRAGADTFFEAWDPKDPKASPYGGAIVNSCCHAWSCTPAYILARFFA